MKLLGKALCFSCCLLAVIADLEGAKENTGFQLPEGLARKCGCLTPVLYQDDVRRCLGWFAMSTAEKTSSISFSDIFVPYDNLSKCVNLFITKHECRDRYALFDATFLAFSQPGSPVNDIAQILKPEIQSSDIAAKLLLTVSCVLSTACAIFVHYKAAVQK